MSVIIQEIGIGIETTIAMTCVSGECPEQLLDSMPGSPIPQRQKSVENISDQEYAIAMEERYGICEEGIF